MCLSWEKGISYFILINNTIVHKKHGHFNTHAHAQSYTWGQTVWQMLAGTGFWPSGVSLWYSPSLSLSLSLPFCAPFCPDLLLRLVSWAQADLFSTYTLFTQTDRPPRFIPLLVIRSYFSQSQPLEKLKLLKNCYLSLFVWRIKEDKYSFVPWQLGCKSL